MIYTPFHSVPVRDTGTGEESQLRPINLFITDCVNLSSKKPLVPHFKSLALDENDADTYDERIANLSKENQQVIERILCSLETEERVKEEKEGTSQGR
jgi:hypothetical protein